jgi:DNA-damage-inducible protein J
MAENSVVRARIDEATKSEAGAVLATIGLTLSDAFRLMVKRIAAEKALPFEPLTPNTKTIAAMKAARRGELVTAGKPASLLASLNANDKIHEPLQTRLPARKVGRPRQKVGDPPDGSRRPLGSG